ncbi:MAG: efflux RND transporter periplasmic adaptor subunit [Gemmatimonadales bacterium]
MLTRIRIRIRQFTALCTVVGLVACGRSTAPEAVGSLEVTTIDLAPMVPARVVRVLVEEGQRVQPGDTVAILTQAGLRDQVSEARARVASAEAQVQELERGARPEEIAKAEQDLAAATAIATNAAADLARSRTLAANNVIPKQQLDQAEARSAEAEARRSSLEQALRLVREGARAERRTASRADLARARAGLSAMEASVGDLVLISPVAGIVLVRAAEPGEVLGAGIAAISVGDVSRPWVRVYVGQGVLPTLQIGDTVEARLDAFPDSVFHGRIAALATKAEYTPRVALTERERADLLFGVKIEFIDGSGMLKPGVPVTVKFRVGS